MATIANFIQTLNGRKKTSYQNGVMPIAASISFNAGGGRYVTIDGNGNYDLSYSASTKVDGWVDTCYTSDHNGSTASTSSTPITSSSTAGATTLEGTSNIHAEDNAYWLPVYTGETIAAADKGKLCDLAIIGSTTAAIQYVRPSVTTNKIVKILDIDTVNNLALVYALA